MRAARTNHLDICCAVLAAGVVSLCLRPAAARANPAEIFGFGSEHAAMAGVGTARADDFSAAYYNPAGLAFSAGKRLSLGALGFVSNLSINDRRMPIAEPLGLTMGLSAPLPVGGDLAERVQIGVGVYLLPTIGARIIARLPDEPFFPYYDNRTQRAVLLPSLAVRLSERWSVGVAANALATLSGRVAAAQGPTRGLDARLDQEVPTLARFHLGARFRPRPSLDLGLSFRQAFSVPFSTIADVEVAGEPIDISIRASGLFTPMQVSGGLFWHPDGSAGALSADITWANWSAYPGPFVHVQSALPLVGPLAAELPRVPYRDTIGVRLGAEAAIGAMAVRGGYGFESSPIPAEQSGTTNLADGHKHIVSAGAGIAVPAVLAGLVGARSMRVDVHAQAQLVSERRYHKRLLGDGEVYDPFTSLRDEVTDDPSEPATQGAQISNPGYPDLRSGGQVMSAGVTVEVGF